MKHTPILYLLFAVICFSCDTQKEVRDSVIPGELSLKEMEENELKGRRWHKTSLEKETAFDFITGDNGILFAATTGGIYSSLDQGMNWKKIETGNITYFSSFTKNEEGMIFAAAKSDGILKTEDNGITWENVNHGIYLGGSNEVNSVTHFRGSIFAATKKAGIYRSDDNGNTWKRVNKGLHDLVAVHYTYGKMPAVYSFTVSDSLIYSLTNIGVFYSFNKGEHWIKCGDKNVSYPGMFSSITSVNNVLTAGRYLKEGIYFSNNSGYSWNMLGLEGHNINALFISKTGNIYVGSADRLIYRSSDNGLTWQPIGKNLPKGMIFSIGSTPKGYILTSVEGKGIWRMDG